MRRRSSKSTTDPADSSVPRPRFSRGGMVQQFDDGRTCAEPGCDTKLSRYNALLTCSLHGDEDRRPG